MGIFRRKIPDNRCYVWVSRRRKGATRPRGFFPHKKPQSCEKALVLILKMALQSPRPPAPNFGDVCLVFLSEKQIVLLRKKFIWALFQNQ
ncbi:hypothetical protein COV77_02315 [Candidatus Pacearchaeota archaeon CG11_big_fil_rev_8_21_14_0_20_30_13]|nr:MAG: hypothetical protein COV77_02315 [Candidatus Pacearchaeota archaeon CG11_big_fil_rev_8_21_14_0_20_30_13]